MPEERDKSHGCLTDRARDAAQIVTVPLAQFLARLGVHPNVLSITGFLLSLGVGVVLATGRFALGGWLVIIVAPLDALDGALARAIDQENPFGAFLDSTLDRLSDASFIAGLTVYYLGQQASIGVILSILTLVGVILVSYTRARAESSGITCTVGILTRLERTVVLAVGLILGAPVTTLWVLAIGSAVTVGQRIVYVYRVSNRDVAEEQSQKSESPDVG